MTVPFPPALIQPAKTDTRHIPAQLSTYAAVFVEGDQIRRLWFQAVTEHEARGFCVKFHAGFDRVSRSAEVDVKRAPEPYSAKTAQAMLGGISESTLYRELNDGRLGRVGGTRHVFIPRHRFSAG
jgi:hypothetical protein